MGASNFSLLNQLESLHIKAVRLVQSILSNVRENEVLDAVDWKPLSYIYKGRFDSIMFQIHTEPVPRQIIDLFGRNDSTIR